MEQTTLQHDIEKVREELQWLDSSPIPHEELKARIATEVSYGLERRDPNDAALVLSAMASAARGLEGCSFADMFVIRNIADQKAGRTSGSLPIEIPLSLALSWVFGSQLNTRINEKIDALQYTPGPPMAERPARRAQLLATLHQLEQTQGEI